VETDSNERPQKGLGRSSHTKAKTAAANFKFTTTIFERYHAALPLYPILGISNNEVFVCRLSEHVKRLKLNVNICNSKKHGQSNENLLNPDQCRAIFAVSIRDLFRNSDIMSYRRLVGTGTFASVD
jgi:hypothetical protein